MKIVKLVMLATAMIYSAAIAADEVERKMAVKVVVAGDGADESSDFSWTSDNMDFDMQDLAVDETWALESASGRDVSVTRSENGFSFEIDGKTVEMPDIGAHGTHMAFVNADDMDHEIDIEVMGDGHAMSPHRQDGVTIISSKPLDTSVRESIKSVLISAGNGDEVTFIDGSAEGKRVFMMKKKVEVH
jgi:hypothetical protein